MKPLLNVTRQDDELRNLVDTLTMEKSKLNEQLTSEQDMLNEAEEVSTGLSVGRSVAE